MGGPIIKAKAAIFDLDCTLVDTLDRFFGLFNELLEKRGLRSIAWDEFFDIYVADSLDDLIATSSDPRREQKLHDFWIDLLRGYRAADPKGKLIPGALETLRDLSKMGVPTAVITSCIVPPAELKGELKKFGISGFVREIVTAHDVVNDLERGHHFSKVEILELAAERLGVDPNDCVVVGDYWNDMRDGKAIGAKTVAVLTGHMRRELLEEHGPDAVIQSVKDLQKVVKFEVRRTKEKH